MFETTQDILFLVLSICVLVLSGFFCWVLLYLGRVLKQSNEVITEFRVKMAQLEESLSDLKEKVKSSTSTIAFVAKEIGQMTSFLKGVKDARRSRKNKN